MKRITIPAGLIVLSVLAAGAGAASHWERQEHNDQHSSARAVAVVNANATLVQGGDFLKGVTGVSHGDDGVADDRWRACAQCVDEPDGRGVRSRVAGPRP